MKSPTETIGKATNFGLAAIAGVLTVFVSMSCSVPATVTTTKRSSIEQLLLVRSLERAAAGLDLKPFAGKSVTVEAFGLTEDREFVKEYIIARLQEHRVRIAADPARAEIRLKIFVSSLGVDRSERLVGIPAFQAPVVNTPIPEIALFKSVYSRGRAELQVYSINNQTKEYVGKSKVTQGEANYDDYKVLLVIDFNVNDLDEPPGAEPIS
jgi:hypothetical protein